MPIAAASVPRPAPSSTLPQGRTHLVRAGDTLWGIARANGVDVSTLREQNPALRDVADERLPIGAKLQWAAPAPAEGPQAGPTPPAPPTSAAPAAASAATVRASRQAAQTGDAAARARIATLPGTRLEALVQQGRQLAQGASGPEVLDLQRFLGMKTIDQDGQFGPKTAEKLREAQQQANLPADGAVGPETMAMLKRLGSASSDAKDLELHVATENPLREGESGGHVRGVQRLLGFGPKGVTGVYGPTTRGAVEDVQRRVLGMTPESPGWGTVGPRTYEALRQSASSAAGGPASHLKILAQRDATSCGLTSVAMVTNAWNKALGTSAAPITDRTLRAELGGRPADLRAAMTRHLPPGVSHYDRDWPRGARSFGDIDAQLARGNPVIIGVGRPFTASGYGHIFVLNKKNSDGTYDAFDPNGAVRRTVSQSALANAGEHSEGSFYMVAQRR